MEGLPVIGAQSLEVAHLDCHQAYFE